MPFTYLLHNTGNVSSVSIPRVLLNNANSVISFILYISLNWIYFIRLSLLSLSLLGCGSSNINTALTGSQNATSFISDLYHQPFHSIPFRVICKFEVGFSPPDV